MDTAKMYFERQLQLRLVSRGQPMYTVIATGYELKLTGINQNSPLVQPTMPPPPPPPPGTDGSFPAVHAPWGVQTSGNETMSYGSKLHNDTK